MKKSKPAKGKIPINKLASAIASVATTSDSPSNSVKPDDDMKWKARNALEDIQRAEQHKKDAGLMKAVKNLAKEQMSTLKKI